MQSLAAELLGTALIAMTVVGSGAMAQSLTDDVALQLLINAAATGAILYLVIHLFIGISGAHFNPAVTVIDALMKKKSVLLTLGYMTAQIIGAIAGVAAANIFFAFPALEISTRERTGGGLFFSEIVATAGLIFLIHHLALSGKEKKIPVGVALWIFAAYFSTSSTSFANPAITFGRIFTKSFAGISPDSALIFIPFQFLGAVIGLAIAIIFIPRSSEKKKVN